MKGQIRAYHWESTNSIIKFTSKEKRRKFYYLNIFPWASCRACCFIDVDVVDFQSPYLKPGHVTQESFKSQCLFKGFKEQILLILFFLSVWIF